MKHKRRTPRQEKELDYERQHVSPGKRDKGFRKQWPRKKATSQRQYRHKVANILAASQRNEADEIQSDIAATKRESVRKWSIITLRERIENKKARRRAMIGARKKRQTRLTGTNQDEQTNRRL